MCMKFVSEISVSLGSVMFSLVTGSLENDLVCIVPKDIFARYLMRNKHKLHVAP